MRVNPAARLLLALLLCAALGFAATACGGGDDDQAQPSPPAGTEPENGDETDTGPVEEPPIEPQEMLQQFLQAVEDESPRAWDLVAAQTKRTFEFTQEHFMEVLLPTLKEELEPGGAVVFQERIDERRALVVVESGTEDAPFAAPLRVEDGTWKIELFYPEFTPNRPEPGEEVQVGDEQLLLDVVRRADQAMEVRVWLDGEPIQVELENVGTFVNTYTTTLNVTQGRHLVVAHALTDAGQSGAAAWTFVGR